MKIKGIIIAIMMLAALPCCAQKISGTWSGVLEVGPQKLTTVFHLSQDNNGNDVCTLDSPDQGAKGITAVVNHLSEDSLNVSAPIIGMTYAGKLLGNVIKGTFTQGGMNLPLQLEAGMKERNRPQTPVAPFPYKTEEVKFVNADANAMLAGTLAYPVGYEDGRKVPVVLLVTGSGQQNRDEELFDHKPFLVIADYFARHGIATLRYDDRGFASSTGDANGITTRDKAEDAKAGVEFLMQQGKFSNIGVLGHSEGASIAFMLAAEDKADFVISLAGIGVKGDTALTAQVNRMAELMGQSARIVSVEQYRANAAMMNARWLNFFIDYEPCADISASKCPVMALNGSNDVQVVSSLNLSGIRRCLSHNEMNVVREYPGLNHMFQSCTTGLVDEYANIEETISPVVLKDMAEWIAKVAGSRY
ncbi:MAG: alpha/beta hydrolase [Prevotella sp.]|nr:alpha/beta hydrolase [Prevotella sp.]